jgi:hypothetical protein
MKIVLSMLLTLAFAGMSVDIHAAPSQAAPAPSIQDEPAPPTEITLRTLNAPTPGKDWTVTPAAQPSPGIMPMSVTHATLKGAINAQIAPPVQPTAKAMAELVSSKIARGKPTFKPSAITVSADGSRASFTFEDPNPVEKMPVKGTVIVRRMKDAPDAWLIVFGYWEAAKDKEWSAAMNKIDATITVESQTIKLE